MLPASRHPNTARSIGYPAAAHARQQKASHQHHLFVGRLFGGVAGMTANQENPERKRRSRKEIKRLVSEFEKSGLIAGKLLPESRSGPEYLAAGQ